MEESAYLKDVVAQTESRKIPFLFWSLQKY